MNEYTKQGVRNLNNIKGKSNAKKLDEMPPEVDLNCKHNFVAHEVAVNQFVYVCRCGAKPSKK
jgi:hypothetical protein